MQPTKEQIISITGYAKLHDSIIQRKLEELQIAYTTNLTALNKVWANVYEETNLIIDGRGKYNIWERIIFQYYSTLNTNNIPAACIAVAEGIELLNKLKK